MTATKDADNDRAKAGKKPATIKRYVANIARVRVAVGLLNPCSSEAVRLGLDSWGMSFNPSIAGLLSMGHNLRSALLASGLSVGLMAAAGAETRPAPARVRSDVASVFGLYTAGRH